MKPHATGSASKAAGFTLFEVLISVAVAMVLVTAIVRVFGSAWLQAATSGDDASAALLARSLMADLRTEQISGGIRREGTANGLRWRITSDRIELNRPPSVSDPHQSPDVGSSPDAAGTGQSSAQTGSQSNAATAMELYRIHLEVASRSGRVTSFEELIATDGKPSQKAQ